MGRTFPNHVMPESFRPIRPDDFKIADAPKPDFSKITFSAGLQDLASEISATMISGNTFVNDSSKVASFIPGVDPSAAKTSEPEEEETEYTDDEIEVAAVQAEIIIRLECLRQTDVDLHVEKRLKDAERIFQWVLHGPEDDK